MGKSTWTEQEIQLLKELYPSVGVEIPEIRANHSPTAILSKASKLGVSYDAENKWTDEEIAILKDKYPKLGWRIPELLKTRPKSGIMSRASRLGLTRAPWSDEEIALLKDKYYYRGTNIPELLERHGWKSIAAKARELGLRRAWTEQEDAELRDAVIHGRTPNIPGRTRSAVSARMNILGLAYSSARVVAKRKDVGVAAAVGSGYIAVKCRVCGRVYLMTEEQAKVFEHGICANLIPVPHGWRVPKELTRNCK